MSLGEFGSAAQQKRNRKVSRYTSSPNKGIETATALKKGRDTRKSALEMPPTTFLEYSWLS